MNFKNKLFNKNNKSNTNNDLPKFKYYRDPIKTKAFIKTNEVCEVCKEQTNYIYHNAFYSKESIEKICPNCIATGKAAKKYDGTFQDIEIEDINIDKEKLEELVQRTPGLEMMNSINWPCHCRDICVFIDYVGWKDIVKMRLEKELKEDLERICKELDCKKSDIGNLRKDESSLSGYLFRCTECGKYRLAIDLD